MSCVRWQPTLIVGLAGAVAMAGFMATAHSENAVACAPTVSEAVGDVVLTFSTVATCEWTVPAWAAVPTVAARSTRATVGAAVAQAALLQDRAHLVRGTPDRAMVVAAELAGRVSAGTVDPATTATSPAWSWPTARVLTRCLLRISRGHRVLGRPRHRPARSGSTSATTSRGS
jgi:hypothetical protein